jgi:hypothetical protein
MLTELRPLVFMHIPKTSGIAVAHAMVAAARPQRVFFGFDRAFFGGFGDFLSLAEEQRRHIQFSADTIPRDELVVRAHMALSTLREAYPDGRMMTVLREPVCRVLSHFVFWRGFAEAQLAGWGGWADRMRLAMGGLAEFLASPLVACQVDNVAVRLLLWPHKHLPDDGFILPKHDDVVLREALYRLGTVDFADAIDCPGFADRLGQYLGVDVPPDIHNKTQAIPVWRRMDLDAALTPSCLELLEARTRLDRVLWDHLVARVVPGGAAEALSRRLVLRGVARCARLLAA